MGAAAAMRITPAHAGKTAAPHTELLFQTDHPRACGENYTREGSRAVVRGSPPRMRGKHPSLEFLGRGERITPAHAGKT